MDTQIKITTNKNISGTGQTPKPIALLNKNLKFIFQVPSQAYGSQAIFNT